MGWIVWAGFGLLVPMAWVCAGFGGAWRCSG